MHLECPAFRAAGVPLPGAPGLWIGHNEHIAWGMTAGLADIQDAYAEEIDREAGRYRRGDDWVDAQTADEPIGVRGEIVQHILALQARPK